MHAVVVEASIGDIESAENELRQQVVPSVSQSPGFVTAFWLEPTEDHKGLSIVVFDSEDAARGMAEMVRTNAPPEVTIENVEVRAVIASA